MHGVGWQNGKGCAIGCTLEAYDHARYETELGIPQMLARLEDCIFEGLPNGEAQQWPERFLQAVQPNQDLSLVGWQFLAWQFTITQKRYATEAVRKACAAVGKILAAKAAGKKVEAEGAWAAARSAAWSSATARETARAAETERAWAAAMAAAWSAEAASAAARSAAAETEAEAAATAARAAQSAVWSAAAAAEAAEARAAEAAAYMEMAGKLVELITTAPWHSGEQKTNM